MALGRAEGGGSDCLNELVKIIGRLLPGKSFRQPCPIKC